MAVTQRVMNHGRNKPVAIIGLGTLHTAADTDRIVTTANMKVGTYTVAAQPYCPSLITVTTSASGTADTQGTITIAGTDIFGVAQTDVIIPVAGSTVSGVKYFKTVTSVTGAGWVIDVGAGNDTIIVGVPASGGIHAPGMLVSFGIVTGNVWVNPLATAVANSTSIPKIAGDSEELMLVPDTLSLISDGSGGTFYAYIYDTMKY